MALEADEQEERNGGTGPTRSPWIRVWRWSIRLLLAPVLLLLLAASFLYVPAIQDLVRQRAVTALQERIGTRVALEHIALRFPIGLALNGLYIEDQRGDTLLSLEELKAQLSVGAIFDKRIAITGLALSHVRANLEQDADSTFNFEHIIKAFTGNDAEPKAADTTGGWAFSLDGVALMDIHYTMAMAPSQLGLDLRLGQLDLDLKEFDLDRMRFHGGDLALSGTALLMTSAPSAPTPDTYPDLIPPFPDLDIDLEHAMLTDIDLRMGTVGTDDSLWVALETGEMEVKEMDFARQRFHFSRIALDRAEFGMLRTDTTTTDGPSGDPPWLDQDDGFRYFLRDFDIAVDELRMSTSALAMHTGRVSDGTGPFDMKHVVIQELDARIDALVANNAGMRADIHGLDARSMPEGSRMRLDALVMATPAMARIDEVRVAWNDLVMGLSARVEHGSLTRAYRSPGTVPWFASVEGMVERAMWSDLIRLLPVDLQKFKSVPEGFAIALHASGTMQALDTVRASIHGDAGTTMLVAGRVNDLLDTARLSYDLRIEPFEMGDGARSIARAFVPPGTVLPAQLAITAQVRGSRKTIEGALDLRSDLGDVRGPFAASGLDRTIPDAATIDLRATDLAMARILGDTPLERADLHVVGEVDDLNSAQRRGWVEVSIARLGLGNDDADTLTLRADLRSDSIRALGRLRSEPITLDLMADGLWPVNGDSLTADLDLHLDHADLMAIGLMKHPLYVAGDWHGHAAIDTSGYGSLSLTMDSTRLQSDSKRFLFKELRAHAMLAKDSTAATIVSDALDLSFSANVSVDTLLERASAKAASFFSADTRFKRNSGERFDMAVELKRTEWLTGMLVPQLQAIELERLDAHYDGDADHLDAALVLTHLRYDSIQVDGVEVNINARGADLDASLATQRMEKGPYHVAGTTITANGSSGDISAQMRIAEEETEQYRISAQVMKDGAERVVRFDREQVLAARTWKMDPANELRVGGDHLVAEHFELRSGDEALSLRTQAGMLEALLDGFRISTITNIISTADSVPIADGRINGSVRIPLEQEQGLEADLTIGQLKLLETEVGTLDVRAVSTGVDRYHAAAQLSNSSNALDATADVAPDDVRARADIDLGDIAFLKPFLSEYLYDLRGGVSGSVDYHDRYGRLDMGGRLRFQGTAVGVVLTGSTYTLLDETMVLDSKGLLFDHFQLRDSIGNMFRLDGEVQAAGLVDPRLDLRIRTDRFQLIGSTIEQNERFYGDLFANMDIQVMGPATRPSAKGDLGILEGTSFSLVLPGSTVELVPSEGIVVFTDDLYAVDTLVVDGDTEALRDSLAAHLPGVELDLRVRVDRSAQFAIVLDPAAGDQATVSGAADLTFRYAPETPMFLSGSYTVEKGEYALDLYGLVKKRFTLTKGGTVRWSGDPVKAEMELQARYISETSPYSLVASTSPVADMERNRLQQPLPFAVLINIDGTMNDPDIGFGLDLQRQLRNSFPKVGNKLDHLNAPGNEEELNRQVFGLLVLNSFIQDEGSGGAPSSGIATSAARNSVNGLLTDQMNKLTGRYLKGVDISLGVNTYDQANGNNTYQRTSVDYKVSKRLLDDRLSFEVGGSVGVDEQDAQVSNVSNTRAAQYAILYDLTRDGRFRIRGFHENAYDLYDGEITNSGVAIMFTRDFEENERARTRNRENARQRKEAEEERRDRQQEEMR
ncbi:MAG TPA: translocation/assembly module TamB domain-containing protein [Flavobacteriales bacterium]|nr:translocation/assembly module TamB domain-containing protein [Flavobacteriales bacterium]